MVKPIIHDTFFLAQKSKPATKADTQVATDLLDTLLAHTEDCVGLAANMIGVAKQVIAFYHEGKPMVMYNPQLVFQSQPFETEERCLSLEGSRKTRRFRSIKVEFLNEKFQKKTMAFTDWTAQIIQHELDHCQGILI